jgi:uroporphyrinogen-III synthase
METAMISGSIWQRNFWPKSMASTFDAKIQTERLKLTRTSAAALSQLDIYDWLLFTSKHAVEYFAAELRERKMRWPKVHYAAVGPVTAKELDKYGIRIDSMPEKSTVKGMVQALGTLRDKKILFPRSKTAPLDSVRALQKAGAKVTVISLYTTKPVLFAAKDKTDILRGKYLSLSFKSPSGVRGFIAQFDPAEKKTVKSIEAKCIGPTTAAAAKKAGFRNVVDLSI